MTDFAYAAQKINRWRRKTPHKDSTSVSNVSNGDRPYYHALIPQPLAPAVNCFQTPPVYLMNEICSQVP